jgi:hypothetical protein
MSVDHWDASSVQRGARAAANAKRGGSDRDEAANPLNRNFTGGKETKLNDD